MINYQDIKIFNKHGNEIPLMFTSNIIFTTANSLELLDESDIMLYGYYNGSDKTLLDAKIIKSGKLTYDKFNDVLNNGLSLNCYVDGILVNDNVVIQLNESNFNRLYFTTGSNTSLRLDSLTANSESDESVVYYSLNNLNINDDKLKISCDLSDYDLLFPSAIFIGNVEIDKVSVGLVETETLIFGTVDNGVFSDILTDNNYELKLITNKSDEDIRFIKLNYVTNEISKSHECVLNNTDEQYVNIGFFPKQEGVYEQDIWVCLVDKTKTEDNIIKIGQLIVSGEAIGHDERYNALFENFGVLNPTTYYNVFKEHNLHEENPDWELINSKSKELFLTYSEIFPYIGTYKALINAVDFLGYDDIYFREWFKILNDESDKEISYRININNKFDDINSRNELDIFYKKLNKLTMVYKLHQETGEFDEYNIPVVDYVYDYSITEILTKLIMLKEWLERNIIAVNCKIVDITGEGIVYERLDYISYGTIMQNIDYEDILQISPKLKNNVVKLIDGSANIEVGNLISSVTNYINISDFDNLSISDFSENNSTVEYPYISDFIVKGYIDTSNAIISDNVTKPLWINNNDLYFLKKKDVDSDNVYSEYIESIYGEVSLDETESFVYIAKAGNFITSSEFIEAPIIHLQRGYLRYNKNDWADNIKYTILPDTTEKYSYAVINDKGNIEFSYDYIILYPDDNASLKYTIDNVYNVPLFMIKNYKFVLYNSESNTYMHPRNADNSAFTISDEYYILDIQDGKIINPASGNKQCTINFNYDDSKINKQSVSAAFEYRTTHNYYSKTVDNEHYTYDEYCTLNVNNIGHYDIFVYAFNNNGNIFAKKVADGCDVIMDKADISIYSDISVYHNSTPFYNKDVYGKECNNIDLAYTYPDMHDNSYPIFRDNYTISELSYGKQNDLEYIKYPSTTYASHIAENGDYIHLMNISDKFNLVDINENNNTCQFISASDKLFNVFPKLLKYNKNTVNVVLYNKLQHKGIYEFSCEIEDNGMLYDNNKLLLKLKPINKNDLSEIITIINVNNSDYNCEFYIQPTTIYSIKSIETYEGKTKLFLNDEFINDIDIDNIFNAGDCIKVMYSINKYDDVGAFIKVGAELTENNIIYNNDELNITYYKSINQYIDASNNQYLKLYKTNNSNNQYTGYTTYRVLESDNSSIVLNDKFNYIAYNESYLLSDINKVDNIYEEINSDLKSHIPGKYIVRYGYSDNNIIGPVILKDEKVIKTNNGTYSFNAITANIEVAKAHQAFVRYTMQCDHSQEYFNSYTKLFTTKNRLYPYLDNSFSFIISKFDQDNAYRFWKYNYKQPINIYEYNEPITMLASSDYKDNLSEYTGNEVILTSEFKDQKFNYTYWKVYKQNQNNESRTLLFEVLNNKLFLKIPNIGIYDIEAYNYDIYGNLSLVHKEALINVK